MNFSISNIKEESKNSLKGKYFKYFLMVLGLLAISLIPELFRPDKSSLIFELITLIISVFVTIYCYLANLNIANGKDDFIPDMMNTLNLVMKGFTIVILTTIVSLIGLIFFIIPGIILSFMFSQAIYILIEDNSKSAIDCMIESKNMMKGNILNLICLNLSYFPEVILCIITFGIYAFWAIPRMDVSLAYFYIHVRDSYYNRTDTFNTNDVFDINNI